MILTNDPTNLNSRLVINNREGINMHVGNFYWIGGNDRAIEAEWRWLSDGALLSSTSQIVESGASWVGGEPGGGTSYNAIRWYYNGNYYAGAESWDYRYVCEHESIYSSEFLKKFWKNLHLF